MRGSSGRSEHLGILTFFKTFNLATRGYAFRPLDSLNFGRLVLPTVPVHKIMALISSSARSLECPPGVWGFGIALLRSNWGVKAGDGLEKSRDYAFCPFGSPNFGALVLLTLPVYKIMALICSSVRSRECLPGFWGLGITSVSGNWGAKGGDVLEKHKYERLKVLTLCWPRGREKLLLQKMTRFSLT